jgi:hypothetical protein
MVVHFLIAAIIKSLSTVNYVEYMTKLYQSKSQKHVLEDAIENNTLYACWNGVEFFRSILGDDMDKVFQEECLLGETPSEGVYVCDFQSNEEVHYFVLYVDQHHGLTVLNTYGGCERLLVKKFANKDRWFDLFNEFVRGDASLMSYLFGIPFECLSCEKISNIVVSYRKIRYND